MQHVLGILALAGCEVCIAVIITLFRVFIHMIKHRDSWLTHFELTVEICKANTGDTDTDGQRHRMLEAFVTKGIVEMAPRNHPKYGVVLDKYRKTDYAIGMLCRGERVF